MISAITDYYWSKKLAHYSCKFASGISTLSQLSRMIFEEHVRLGRIIVKSNGLKIGAFTYVRSGSEIYGACEIGRFCSIGQNVIIGLEKNKHPTHWLSTSFFSNNHESFYVENSQFEPTIIGNDCWIGRDAVIMSGVTVGDGAIIGARAVVTSNIPPFAIYAGVPAKLIRYRFSNELIQRILSIKWWNTSVAYLHDLKVDSPELCLEELTKLDAEKLAIYKKILITNKGVRSIKE